MNRKQMVKHLKEIGLGHAIADENAMVDGGPAVLLRWNGAEEYYTGFDMVEDGGGYADDVQIEREYQQNLIARFGK